VARGCHIQERGRVKEVKKVNIFDVLPTQEWIVFKPVEGDEGKKEKNRRDKPIWVIMHTYMEMSQGNKCIAIF
jgi:hypothetical protein